VFQDPISYSLRPWVSSVIESVLQPKATGAEPVVWQGLVQMATAWVWKSLNQEGLAKKRAQRMEQEMVDEWVPWRHFELYWVQFYFLAGVELERAKVGQESVNGPLGRRMDVSKTLTL